MKPHTYLACMFDDYLWKSYVYQTTFSNVKYQDMSDKNYMRYGHTEQESRRTCGYFLTSKNLLL